jgi:hypothetical protein
MKYLIAGVAFLALTSVFLVHHFTRKDTSHLLEKPQSYHNSLLGIANQINSMKTTWVAGENIRFKGMTLSEIKKQMGVIMDKESPVKLPVVSDMMVGLPESFDSRTNWPKCESL